MNGARHNTEGKSYGREVGYKREINRGRGKFILSWLRLESTEVVLEVLIYTRRLIREWYRPFWIHVMRTIELCINYENLLGRDSNA